MCNCKSFYQVVSFIQLSEAEVLSVSFKMDKIEYRAVIKFFVKEGLTPNEIHSKFIKVYEDSSPSFSTIKKWSLMSHRACCHTCYTIQLMHYSHFKTQSLQNLKPIKCEKHVCKYKPLHVSVFFHDHLQGVLRCALCRYYSSR